VDDCEETEPDEVKNNFSLLLYFKSFRIYTEIFLQPITS